MTNTVFAPRVAGARQRPHPNHSRDHVWAVNLGVRPVCRVRCVHRVRRVCRVCRICRAYRVRLVILNRTCAIEQAFVRSTGAYTGTVCVATCVPSAVRALLPVLVELGRGHVDLVVLNRTCAIEQAFVRSTGAYTGTVCVATCVPSAVRALLPVLVELGRGHVDLVIRICARIVCGIFLWFDGNFGKHDRVDGNARALRCRHRCGVGQGHGPVAAGRSVVRPR